jgi:hypothetical protein
MRHADISKRAFGRLSALVATACTALALWGAPAQAAPPGWPQPGYDGGLSGYTPQAAPITAVNATTLSPAWSVAVPDLSAEGAVVYKGLVITATSGGSAGHVTAYRLADGSVAWAKAVTDSGFVIGDEGRVFASIVDGPSTSPFTGVVALDPATGGELWRRSTGELAPLRADGGRIFTLRDQGTNTVAIGERGGHIKWRALDTRVWAAAGGMVIGSRVGTTRVTGLDGLTRDAYWDALDRVPVGSDPTHYNELAMSGGLLFDMVGRGACTCRLSVYDARTGGERWDATPYSYPTDGVAAGAGRVYQVGQRQGGFPNHLFALDGTGQIVWMTPRDLVSPVKPTITRHLVFAVDLAGTGLVAFNVINGHVAARWPNLVPAGMLRAPMAVGDSVVVVGSGRVLVLRLPAS